ncbi:hypothetical protein L596_008113 [Steinernema carpocapsae]|uniref:Innexin n=1 Tax=Steinernema carpocapsae TaxID=34508 RepID=A0A4U5PC08_STECR|nr:hypothetical protein L596_008113 [Steinernema carpocapsae]
MWSKISSVFSKVNPKYDDDFVDRVNYLYTPFAIATVALSIAVQQHVGEPLQCWVPAEFNKAWEKYSENYCFVENTYYAPVDGNLPSNKEHRKAAELSYYQWVPFILAAQIFCFLLPRKLWSGLNWKSGYHLSSLIAKCANSGKSGDDEKERKLTKAVDEKDQERLWKLMQTYRNLREHHGVGKKKNPIKTMKRPINYYSNYLSCIYILYKIMNLINALLQLYIINYCLGSEYTFWGYEVLKDLVLGRSWKVSGNFPRVAFCDVPFRVVGNQNRRPRTLQCVLPVNMFNEKIFICLWFWFASLAVLNFINLAYWATVTCVDRFAIGFIEAHLLFKIRCINNAQDEDQKPKTEEKKKDEKDDEEKEHGEEEKEQEDEEKPEKKEKKKRECIPQPKDHEIREFFESTLHRDGITILRLLADNCGDIIAGDLLYYLWQQNHKEVQKRKESSGRGEPNDLPDFSSEASTAPAEDIPESP